MHQTLMNYYQVAFVLRQHHNYALTEMDELYPFEKEIYENLLLNHLEKEKEIINANR